LTHFKFETFYQLEKLRPEFQAGLDELTRFIFERTRPKQVAGTIMTGPVLAGVTQSFLDAINSGAVPTISSSWQVFYLLSHAPGQICKLMHIEPYFFRLMLSLNCFSMVTCFTNLSLRKHNNNKAFVSNKLGHGRDKTNMSLAKHDYQNQRV